jgi:oligoribonuclease
MEMADGEPAPAEGPADGSKAGVAAAASSPVLTAFPAPAFPLTSRLAADRVLWIDLEMTNIVDVARGRIMEVGAVVTGPAMEWLQADEERGVCTTYHRVVRLSEAELSDLSEWSRVHHAKLRPGVNMSLLDLCARSGFSLREVEDDLVALVRLHGRGRPMMLAGSSVGCDRAFIDAHMPKLASVLHHRSIDVSTVLELCRRMYPGFRVPAPPAPPGAQHTAMGDILSSLRLMHFLQNTIFMPVLLPVLPHTEAPPSAQHAPAAHYAAPLSAQPRMPLEWHPEGGLARGGPGSLVRPEAAHASLRPAPLHESGPVGGGGGLYADCFGGGYGQGPAEAFHGAADSMHPHHHPHAAAPGRPPIILRQAPPVQSPAMNAAASRSQPYPLRSPILAATAAHGFPMQRRHGR